jgi:hypothetical protein
MTAGAPTSLNNERQAAILNAIRIGATEKRAAAFAGVHLDTIRQWRRKGESALTKKAGTRSPTERKYAEFVTLFDKALAETAVMMQSVISQTAQRGLQHDNQPLPSIEQQRLSLQAAMWWLAHRERDDYTTRQEITGKDGDSFVMSASEALATFRELANAYPTTNDDDDE